jgi:hypothetical protein
MANLSPRRTGLLFVVWISPKASALHGPRVRVSMMPRVCFSELISVAIQPTDRSEGRGTLSASDRALLAQWIDLNIDVLVRYWDGDIEYTEDAIAALKPLA